MRDSAEDLAGLLNLCPLGSRGFESHHRRFLTRKGLIFFNDFQRTLVRGWALIYSVYRLQDIGFSPLLDKSATLSASFLPIWDKEFYYILISQILLRNERRDHAFHSPPIWAICQIRPDFPAWRYGSIIHVREEGYRRS